MNPDKQRIAIATACGYKHSGTTDNWCIPGGWDNRHHASYWVSFSNLPDYLNDLNAMHEAEKVLIGGKWPFYIIELGGLVMDDEPSDWIKVCNATAEQKAEAFLKSIGKWEA